MSALERLSKRCGIQHVSEDAFGKEHVTSVETKRALLKAMRFPAESEEEAEHSLTQLEREAWGKALPPVHIAYADGQQMALPIVLGQEQNDVHWLIDLEDDQQITGTASWGELPLIEKLEDGSNVLERRSLPLPSDLPWGYHSLRIEGQDGVCALIITPGKCWVPAQPKDKHRLWGVAAQLYLLRSEHNWGMGDFTDLRELAELCRRHGADVVGVNPLHAMFPDKPEQASPYSPSDRLLLNVLYIDVESIPELASSEEARNLLVSPDYQQQLASCRGAALVDYKAIAAMKLPILRLLFSAFEKVQDQNRLAKFTAFHAERRTLLDRACLFQALQAYFSSAQLQEAGGSEWPEGFRSSNSPEVTRFIKEHPDLIRFQLWLQWVADEQLRTASETAKEMSIGLYRDLAVGAHPSGAEVWSFPDALVSGASVGAPPDIWNPAGQNWGLPPLHPLAARQCGYRNFIELLQANMRYAGALRIDHALALQRLYLIPEGEQPKDGAYVQYPTDELIGILALESHRNKCLVIGEDLGTVPKGFRERMAQANILSYRVLFFERDEECFLPPDEYSALSLSVASSHDLPTLRGWWQGSDIDLKERLHLFPDAEDASKARKKRGEDRDALVAALVLEHLLPAGVEVDLDSFVKAVHHFLSKTNSLLTLVQLDDLAGEEIQVNVPATSDENPNWRRKLALSLEELDRGNVMTELADQMSGAVQKDVAS